MKLQGKKILITGASRGIGQSIAVYCANQGARVGITYSTQESKAREVLASLPRPEEHMMTPLDLSSEESIEKAYSLFRQKMDGIDGLVNNAGLKMDQLVLRMKLVDFESVIRANLTGAYLLTKLAVKDMMKNRSGSIVQITSVSAQIGNPGQSNYAAAKAGLEAFTKSVANEVASRNVRLNCVAPGFIETDMTKTLPEEIQKGLLERIPMGRIARPEEVASTVSFLLSEEASYITGQTLNVNGGLYM